MTAKEQPLPILILAVAAAVAIAYGIFLRSLLAARGNDISRFVIAGGSGVNPRAVPAGLTVLPGIGGYDGVAFYRLALNPWTREVTAFGITLDNPPYRQQRLGYPLLVWLLSLGRPERAPLFLVVVNLAALIGIGVAGGLLARSFGVHALWGLTFAFYPGFLMSLSRDTCEIVAAAFTLAGLSALLSKRQLLAAAFLSLAVLTRETTLITAVAVGGCYLVRQPRGERIGWRVLAVLVAPVTVYVSWQLFLRGVWGSLPLRAGSPGFSLPFREYLAFFSAALPRRTHLQRLYVYECLFLAILAGVAAASALRRRGAPFGWRLAWLGHLTLAAVLPAVMWVEDFGFLRILSDLFVVSVAVIVPTSTWARAVALCVTGAIWYYLAGHIVTLG